MAIHIKPSHKGLLHKALGKKGPLSLELLHKKLAAAKRSGNVKLERQLVFAVNAHSFHHQK